MSESQDQQLINLPLDSHDKSLWLAVKQLESRLHQIARLSVAESTGQRDLLEQQALQFIRGQWIDGINGGFFHIAHEICQFSCYQNALVARILFNIDRVVLNGQFTFVAIFILNNLLMRHYDSIKGNFLGDYILPLKASPIVYSESKIHDLLNEEEFRLYLALTNNFSTILDDERFYISRFNCSLRQAAEVAKIEYKHAQILESLIRHKLSEDGNINLPSQNGSVDLIEQSEILISLTRAIVFSAADQFTAVAKQSAKFLLEQLKLCQRLDDKTIALSYAISFYMQVKIEQSVLDEVLEKLHELLLVASTNLENNGITQPFKHRFNVLILIFKSIASNCEASHAVVNLLQSNRFDIESLGLEEPTIVVLEESLQGRSQRADLLARYDESLFLFTK